MIIPKCCSFNPNIKKVFTSTVEIYYKKLNTITADGKQISSYSSNLVATKKCLIKDRTNAAIDAGMINEIRDPSSLKELIFEYFDITGLTINQVKWAGSTYDITGVPSPLKSFTYAYERYTATDARPFISMFIGLKNL
jgi:hypothetical protein